MTTVKFTLTVEVPAESAEKVEGLLRTLADRLWGRLTRVEYEGARGSDWRLEKRRRTLRKIGRGS